MPYPGLLEGYNLTIVFEENGSFDGTNKQTTKTCATVQHGFAVRMGPGRAYIGPYWAL